MIGFDIAGCNCGAVQVVELVKTTKTITVTINETKIRALIANFVAVSV